MDNNIYYYRADFSSITEPEKMKCFKQEKQLQILFYQTLKIAIAMERNFSFLLPGFM